MYLMRTLIRFIHQLGVSKSYGLNWSQPAEGDVNVLASLGELSMQRALTWCRPPWSFLAPLGLVLLLLFFLHPLHLCWYQSLSLSINSAAEVGNTDLTSNRHQPWIAVENSGACSSKSQYISIWNFSQPREAKVDQYLHLFCCFCIFIMLDTCSHFVPCVCFSAYSKRVCGLRPVWSQGASHHHHQTGSRASNFHWLVSGLGS